MSRIAASSLTLSNAASDVCLVVFDMDGVLVDTTPCHQRAYASLWEHLGIGGPQYAEIAGRRTLDVVREYAGGRGASPTEIARLVDFKQRAARDLLASEDIVFDDAERTVRRLADAGFSLALGTGASRGGVAIVLDRLDCGSLFKAVVTAEDVSHGKPDPEVFERTCKLGGHAPANTLVIEDSSSGVDAALAAGCFVVAVRSKVENPARRFLGAFADLDEVAEALTAKQEEV